MRVWKECSCRKAVAAQVSRRRPGRNGFAGRIGRTGPSPAAVFPTPDRACASCHIREGMYLSEGRSRAGFVAVSEKGWIRWKNRLCRFHPLRPFSPLQTALARHATSGKACTCRKAVATQISWRCPERDRFAEESAVQVPSPRPLVPSQTALARMPHPGRDTLGDTLVQRATAAQASIPATDYPASGCACAPCRAREYSNLPEGFGQAGFCAPMVPLWVAFARLLCGLDD